MDLVKRRHGECVRWPPLSVQGSGHVHHPWDRVDPEHPVPVPGCDPEPDFGIATGVSVSHFQTGAEGRVHGSWLVDVDLIDLQEMDRK